jgi:HK97 family phage major capsid protein
MSVTPRKTETSKPSIDFEHSSPEHVQREIRRVTAKGEGKTLGEAKYLRQLHARAAKLNAEQRVRDDAEVNRAKETFRAKRALRADSIDVMAANAGELRDASLQVLERDGQHLSPAQQDAVDLLARESTEDFNSITFNRRLITTQAPAYRSALVKEMQPGHNPWTQEEGAAITAYRAANEGTGSAAGFGVPVLVDPSIIVSAGASSAPVMQLATVISINTDQWKGVTAAAAPSWGFKAEAAVVADSTPTFAQSTIPVYNAAGYIEASYELLADYPNAGSELLSVLTAGYTDMVANVSVTGNGSGEPYGVFVQMMNTTTSPSHITVTTAGQLSAVDVRKAWQALPLRARGNATWLANGSVETLVKNFAGTSGGSLVDYVATLTESGTRISALEGREFVTSDYCSSFSGSTSGAAGIVGTAMVVGDFKAGMRVVQRQGLSMEVVQHVPNLPTSNVPTMSRGLYCTARVGWSIVVPDFFRVISNA